MEANKTIRINPRRLAQIARRYKLDLVVLFGSQAGGRHTRESDIDVAVGYQPGIQPDFDRDLALMAALDEAIQGEAELDVAFLNGANSTLLFEVAATGRLLYERIPLLFRQFQSYAARRFDDDRKFRYWRDLYVQNSLRKWAHEK